LEYGRCPDGGYHAARANDAPCRIGRSSTVSGNSSAGVIPWEARPWFQSRDGIPWIRRRINSTCGRRPCVASSIRCGRPNHRSTSPVRSKEGWAKTGAASRLHRRDRLSPGVARLAAHGGGRGKSQGARRRTAAGRRQPLKAFLKTPRGPASRDFGGGQGGEAGASQSGLSRPSHRRPPANDPSPGGFATRQSAVPACG